MTPLYAPLFLCVLFATISAVLSSNALNRVMTLNALYTEAKDRHLKTFGDVYKAAYKRTARKRVLCFIWLGFTCASLLLFLFGTVFYLLTLFFPHA